MLKKILAVLVMLYTALAMGAVDVNKGTEAELDAVKGIGPVTSKMILSERKKGNFKSWEDFIERIKGVGDARAAKLSAEGLTVNGSAYKVATKDTKATAKEDKKETKAAAKEDKKEAKAAAKEEKKDAKEARKDDKVAVTKPAASAAAPAAKPAASAPKK